MPERTWDDELPGTTRRTLFVSPTPPRPERVATDVLVARAREFAEWWRVAQSQWGRGGPTADLLTALADRLAELAALEPVGELLVVMDERPGWILEAGGGRARLGTGTYRESWQSGPHASTTEAVRVLVEQVPVQVRGRA